MGAYGGSLFLHPVFFALYDSFAYSAFPEDFSNFLLVDQGVRDNYKSRLNFVISNFHQALHVALDCMNQISASMN